MSQTSYKIHHPTVLIEESSLYLDGLVSSSQEKWAAYNVSKDHQTGLVNRIGIISFENGKPKHIYEDDCYGGFNSHQKIISTVEEIFNDTDIMICLQTGSHYSLLEKTFLAHEKELPKGHYACVFSLASVFFPNIARRRASYIEMLNIEENLFFYGELGLTDITRAIVEHMITIEEPHSVMRLISARNEKRADERADYFRKEYYKKNPKSE